jgi:hypothetical protein
MNAYVKILGCGIIALGALACGAKGSDDGDDDETGGTSGSSTGGTSGTSTGGTSGTSTGGTSGTSTGGTSGSGQLPVMTTMAFTDASEVCPVGSDANVAGCWKLVDSNADTAVSTAIPVTEIEFRHTTDDGDPDEGAFEATIPYDSPSQWVSFGINFASVDMTNRIITARVKIASGLGDAMDLMMAPGGTKVYAKSGMGYCYANGAYFNQGDGPHPIGTWQTIQFNLLRPPDFTDAACAEPFDPADIREIGVQFDSNAMSTSATEAVVLIDTVTY